MATGRLQNRLGARNLVIFGFGLLTLGYRQSAVSQTGFTALVVASVLVGIGLGVVVLGALRTIAMDEAPPALRGAARPKGWSIFSKLLERCGLSPASARWPTGWRRADRL